MLSTTKLIVASGGLALSLTAGAGIASAGPDVSPIINSTCTYPQVVAALNAQDSGLAAQLSQTPAAQGWLQALVAATTDGERVAGALRGVRRRHLERALSGWSASELAQFDRLLERFLADTTATSINDG